MLFRSGHTAHGPESPEEENAGLLTAKGEGGSKLTGVVESSVGSKKLETSRSAGVDVPEEPVNGK